MKKVCKTNLIFRKGILLFLFLLISLIFIETLFYIEGQNSFLLNHKRNAIFCIIPGVILFSGILLLLLKKTEKIRPCNEKLVICVLWGLIFFIQTIIVFFLIKDGFKGITDTSCVINEAIAMVESQEGLINNESVYFSRYGNNYPFTILIYYICKVVYFFGFRCYTAVLMILNIIFIDLSGIFALKLVRMLRGNISGIKFLLIVFFSPTTYIWIVFTYTNTFSMPFIMGLLYYGIKAMRRYEHRMRNILIAAVLGAVGYQIRATTIIPLIAVIIGILLSMRIRSKKEKVSMILIIIGVFVGVMLVSSLVCRSHLVNTDQDRTFPFTHWMMMGLNVKKNGFVNSQDVKFSMSKPTKQEKVKGNLGKIKERLSEMGPVGYIMLMAKKMALVWGLGSDGYPGFYVNGENISGIYSYTYGDKGGFLAIYCQVFRSVTFLFILFSIFCQLRRKGVEEFFVISLTVLGAIVFFLLWETNRKYNICFMNLLYFLMEDGITRILIFVHKKEKSVSQYRRKQYRWAASLLFFAVPLMTSILMVVDYPYYNEKKSEYHSVAISDIRNKEQQLSLKRKGDVAEQTFITDKEFNQVCVMYKNVKRTKENSYQFQLLNENGDCIKMQNISAKKESKNEWENFDLNTSQLPAGQKKYTIRILCLKNQEKGISVAVTPYDAYDLYTGGSLRVNSHPSKRDMVFCVTYRMKTSIIGIRGYVIFGLLVYILSGMLILFNHSQYANVSMNGCILCKKSGKRN